MKTTQYPRFGWEMMIETSLKLKNQMYSGIKSLLFRWKIHLFHAQSERKLKNYAQTLAPPWQTEFWRHFLTDFPISWLHQSTYPPWYYPWLLRRFCQPREGKTLLHLTFMVFDGFLFAFFGWGNSIDKNAFSFNNQYSDLTHFFAQFHRNLSYFILVYLIFGI